MSVPDLENDRSPSTSSKGDRAITQSPQIRIRICQHTTCLKDGSAAVLQAFQAQQSPAIEVTPSGCLGNCGNGPTVWLLPDNQHYSRVRSQDFAAICAHHLPMHRTSDPQLSRQSFVSKSLGTPQNNPRSLAFAYGLLAIAALLILLTLGWTIYSLS